MNLTDFGVEQPAPERPKNACVRWRECGEIVPANGALCAPCLSSETPGRRPRSNRSRRAIECEKPAECKEQPAIFPGLMTDELRVDTGRSTRWFGETEDGHLFPMGGRHNCEQSDCPANHPDGSDSHAIVSHIEAHGYRPP